MNSTFDRPPNPRVRETLRSCTSRLRSRHLLTPPSDKAQGRSRASVGMTDSETPSFTNRDHVTNACTEESGFGTDATVPGSEFAEGPSR